jgi:hypothetical protein
VKPLAAMLGVARSNLVEQPKPDAYRRRGYGPRPDDQWLLPLIRAIVDERASYGYRRVTALLNRQLQSEGRARVNHKRIYRIMRINHLLLVRHSGRCVTQQSQSRLLNRPSNRSDGRSQVRRQPALPGLAPLTVRPSEGYSFARLLLIQPAIRVRFDRGNSSSASAAMVPTYWHAA